jgi:hypothetical protein
MKLYCRATDKQLFKISKNITIWKLFIVMAGTRTNNTQAHEDWSRGFLDQLNIEIST